MGSSTADVTAVIRAIANFHDAAPTAEEIGRIAVEVERASDPVMIDDRVVLFSHREGTVLETLGYQLPQMIVVGCDADPGTGGVDTIALPPAVYSATDIDTFTCLRSELRVAVATGDVARLARVATSSALINQRFLPKSALDFLLDLCERVGGCGIQVAHSGTVAGVIFDSRDGDVMEKVDRCVTGIEKGGLSLTGIIACSQAPPVSATFDRLRATDGLPRAVFYCHGVAAVPAHPVAERWGLLSQSRMSAAGWPSARGC